MRLRSGSRRGVGRFGVGLATLALAGALVAGCGSGAAPVTTCGPGTGPPGCGGAARAGTIPVVAAENEYGDVASQIGGRYVAVTSVESNPNTDPHTYEVSPRVAQAIGTAALVIQNGVGYDDFMTKVESASPNAGRRVIDVQRLLGLPTGTANPHLWYDPATMPKVAKAVAGDLSALSPAHAAYFEANARRFSASLSPWLAAIARFRATYPGVPVATTEPVADYMLQALGAHDLTPSGLQADIMNGVDPSPQDVALQLSLFTHHRVKALLYNQQVTDSLTQSFVNAAKKAGIPIVGVYETMPSPGYDYQSWMLAEVRALARAVADKTSTERL